MTLCNLHPHIIFTFHYVYIYILSWLAACRPPGDLHSTMFIFILSGTELTILEEQHLHSTMFIFISHWSSLILQRNSIYIPLCLYLYSQVFRCTCNKNNHLHSTMFIFISLRNLKGMKYNLIYIPLCLYLYWEFLKTLNWIVPIFTFHYVYIYIRMTYRITMT